MPCRICTATDPDALLDELARGLWEKQSEGQDVAWEHAPDYWRRAYRQHAEVLLEVARGTHADG